MSGTRGRAGAALNELCWDALTIAVVVQVRMIAIRFKLRLARP